MESILRPSTFASYLDLRFASQSHTRCFVFTPEEAKAEMFVVVEAQGRSRLSLWPMTCPRIGRLHHTKSHNAVE
jgi:hypothetical protein